MQARPETILIVDDDVELREYLRACLEPQGYRIMQAGGGQEALAMARASKPELIISDLHMPQMNGFELTEQLRNDIETAHIPVLMISSQEDRASYRRAFGLGMADYIVKPFKRHDVLATVELCLRRAAERAAEITRIRETAALPALSGYRFIRLLGRGGMSEVYLAEQIGSGRTCAVKILLLGGGREEQSDMIVRFLEERALLARVSHRHVATVFEHGVADDCVFIAMEYFELGDLRKQLTQGLPVMRSLEYARQIGEGLAAIHAYGILHRDLKPANVMVRADGTVAIADFGLARELASGINRTREGQAMGTPRYMSPEQIRGEVLDVRSDLYSFGVMLFEMLSGHCMFASDNIENLLLQHLQPDRPLLPARRSTAVLQPIVDKLVARDPADRFPDARAFLRIFDFVEDMKFNEDEIVRVDAQPETLSLETAPQFTIER